MKRPGLISIVTIVIITIILVIIFSSKSNNNLQNKNQEIETTQRTMKLTSIFQDNERIPEKYTCDGENINPPLEISNIPENTKSLILIMDDPDAPSGTFDHWIVFNIPPNTTKIQENSVPDNSIQGWNGLNKNSYTGPCPPSGTHHYVFKLYALDVVLKIKPSSTKSIVENAMQSHVIEKTELIGLYSRN